MKYANLLIDTAYSNTYITTIKPVLTATFINQAPAFRGQFNSVPCLTAYNRSDEFLYNSTQMQYTLVLGHVKQIWDSELSCKILVILNRIFYCKTKYILRILS